MTRSQKLILLLAAIVALPSAAYAEDLSGWLAVAVVVFILPGALIAGLITARVVREFRGRPGPWYLIPLYALGWIVILILGVWIHYYLQSVLRVIR